MRCSTILRLANLIALIRTQQDGDATKETAPPLTIQQCTKSGCNAVQGVATLDANWRWTYDKNQQNCYKGNAWLNGPCPDGETCAQNCFIDGANYKETYGITSTGDALKLAFVTNGPYSKNFGSRLYFLVGEKYMKFQLKNKEFSFTVDVSQLPCGLNGALYFAGMDEDGGKSQFPSNKAGAKKGTGYCDAQCPQDIKWIAGKANSVGWDPSPTDPNAGKGYLGACCCEVDIWEANSISQAFTLHPCIQKSSNDGLQVCEKQACANGKDDRYKGLCDKDGCDFASFRYNATKFYGPGKQVDTTKKITVITQFITNDKTDNGKLNEIKRIYIQNGKIIKNEAVQIPKAKQPFSSITEDFCDATKLATKDPNDFKAKGGMDSIDKCLKKGMVLVFSIWDDQEAQMNWLDSAYPPNKPKTDFGVLRGTCNPADGKPETVRQKFPQATVEFSEIKFGEIDSTYKTASTSQVPGKTRRK